MGFFSVNCPECGHPMLSEHASNSTNEWMQDCVLIPKDPELDPVRGQYDGYGRVAGEHIYAHRQDGDPWTACVYRHAGRSRASPGNGSSVKTRTIKASSSIRTTITRSRTRYRTPQLSLELGRPGPIRQGTHARARAHKNQSMIFFPHSVALFCYSR